MNKTQYYLSQCAEAAAKSPMCFTLGAVMVKGGKVISSGYNHHRPHYDGSDIGKHGHRKPISMHAEMHAIFNVTGMSPSFKKQVQGNERRVPQRAAAIRARVQTTRERGPPPQVPKGCAAPEGRLSGAGSIIINECESDADESTEEGSEGLQVYLFAQEERTQGLEREFQPQYGEWGQQSKSTAVTVG